ncbi:hypothetical protein K491DRAFT_736769 [Lophiostoma macrostomum CBS 122681]|uniref:Uncharacterized protein n=1 Tax=Lophiostoma macrostomum CBS 122681 TaxID=1314788 RepID=A0A6A6SNW9_9PLEO|nr:hypothetical protein K491DRAFT_736769 [Lophiostoma macrostomum CBS 122681]
MQRTARENENGATMEKQKSSPADPLGSDTVHPSSSTETPPEPDKIKSAPLTTNSTVPFYVSLGLSGPHELRGYYTSAVIQKIKGKKPLEVQRRAVREWETGGLSVETQKIFDEMTRLVKEDVLAIVTADLEARMPPSSTTENRTNVPASSTNQISKAPQEAPQVTPPDTSSSST